MAEIVQGLREAEERARLFARLRRERVGSVGVDPEWEQAAGADIRD